MKPRELKAKLTILRMLGVASYREGDLFVSFRATNEHEAAQSAASADDGNGAAESGPEQMELPEGLFDPLGKIAEINRRARSS